MHDTLRIRRPDDMHLHLRDGAMMAAVLPDTARTMGRAVVMPNLKPPVVTAQQAKAYGERIRAQLQQGSGFQPLITAYLMTVAVLISTTFGVVVGTLCAQHPVSTRFILTVCDTFQTFPSFIYLIPVMMLFGVTDTSVLIASLAYAMKATQRPSTMPIPVPWGSEIAFRISWPKSMVPMKAPMMTIIRAKFTV